MRLHLLAALIATALAGVPPCPSSPAKWILDNTTSLCYLPSSSLTTRPLLSWQDARSYCLKNGGDLPSITTAVQFNAVAAQTGNTPYLTWLGLYRSGTYSLYGYWKWVSGSSYYYNKWIANEPKSFTNGTGCGAIRSLNTTSGPAGFVSLPCEQPQPFVCQQKMATCGAQNRTGTSGIITSPNYPNNYYNNMACNYYITGANGTYITIDFDVIDIEGYADTITLYDGNTNKYLGSIESDWDWETSFESNTNSLRIFFSTDYAITYRGWHATWKAKPVSKPVYQNDTRGELTSPNYPSLYLPYTQQMYYVQGPSGFQINATIDVFLTEGKYDYLEIYDGPKIAANATNLIGNYSGALANLPVNLVTATNDLTLRFMSDGSIQKTGWHLLWNAF